MSIKVTTNVWFQACEYISFIFNFLFHNSHDKIERQIIVSNQISQIESWRKCKCCAWVWKRVCHHQGLNSQPRAWHSVLMIRAECDTTQLFRRPRHVNRCLTFFHYLCTLKTSPCPCMLSFISESVCFRACFYFCLSCKRWQRDSIPQSYDPYLDRLVKTLPRYRLPPLPLIILIWLGFEQRNRIP